MLISFYTWFILFKFCCPKFCFVSLVQWETNIGQVTWDLTSSSPKSIFTFCASVHYFQHMVYPDQIMSLKFDPWNFNPEFWPLTFLLLNLNSFAAIFDQNWACILQWKFKFYLKICSYTAKFIFLQDSASPGKYYPSLTCVIYKLMD